MAKGWRRHLPGRGNRFSQPFRSECVAIRPTARVAFEGLKVKWTWRPIPGCPGRFVLVTDDHRLAVEDVAGADIEIERYRVRSTRDEVLVARLEGGGILSYRRADGTYVHPLNTPEGLARKLGQLGIDRSA